MRMTCDVCMHRCSLDTGQAGICRARGNRGNGIIPLNYGKLTSMALDPVEKKPLRRFCPGSMILSVGSFGCNLKCPFCQNHEISMAGEADSRIVPVTPKQLAEKAADLRARGNIGVAYTYNEPMVGWEFVRDTARLVRGAGMKNVIVTNGSVSGKVLDEVLPFTDAMNIDLKGFTDCYYGKLGGSLEVVKHFIEQAAAGCHVELTTLIVPGENDSEAEIRELAAWVASVDPRIPLHITRFFPRWKMTDRDATDIGCLYALVEAARGRLEYVFAGNC